MKSVLHRLRRLFIEPYKAYRAYKKAVFLAFCVLILTKLKLKKLICPECLI